MSLSVLTTNEIENRIRDFKEVQYRDKMINDSLFLSVSHSCILDFQNCHFKSDINLNFPLEVLYKISFTNCSFESTVDVFMAGSGQNYIAFVGSNFIKGFKLKTESRTVSLNCTNVSWGKIISLNGCKFESLLFIEAKGGDASKLLAHDISVSQEANFSKAVISIVNLSHSLFHGDLTLDSCNFSETNLKNCNFSNSGYANFGEFEKHIFFNGSKVNGKLIAPSLNAKSPKCIGDFSGCVFENDAYFDFSIFDRFACLRSKFKEAFSLNGAKINSVDFAGTLFFQAGDFSNTKFLESNKESFQIIKSQLLRGENKAESLYYLSKELAEYEKKLSGKGWGAERVLLFLNRISNNHGTDWLRGVYFTGVVSILLYTFYLLLLPKRFFVWGWDGWDSFWEVSNNFVIHYFEFIAIFRDFNFIEGGDPNWLSYVIDFFSRIAIGYGIYQTVQAFRKFGKS